MVSARHAVNIMLVYSLALVCWQQWEKSDIREG